MSYRVVFFPQFPDHKSKAERKIESASSADSRREVVPDGKQEANKKS